MISSSKSRIFPRVFNDLEVAICDLKIEIPVFPRFFSDLEVAICDLKIKQVTPNESPAQ